MDINVANFLLGFSEQLPDPNKEILNNSAGKRPASKSEPCRFK